MHTHTHTTPTHAHIHCTPTHHTSTYHSYTQLHLVEKVTDSGPLESAKEDVRQEPLTLPNNFKWDDIDLEIPSQVRYKVCWCQMKWVKVVLVSDEVGVRCAGVR